MCSNSSWSPSPKAESQNPNKSMEDSRLELETIGLASAKPETGSRGNPPRGAELAALAAAMGDLHMQGCNRSSALINTLVKIDASQTSSM